MNYKEITEAGSIDKSRNFPIKVANEIIRMRHRLSLMTSEINGSLQFQKSLDRLEEELNILGFEIPELLNKFYDDGMTIKARFIPSGNRKAGERIITKVIKPQINYKGQLIQMAEVEVSEGTKEK
jgi:hypothetical protein